VWDWNDFHVLMLPFIPGVFFTHTVTPTHLDKEIVEAICKEYKYSSCEVCLHEDATADQLIDVIEGGHINSVFHDLC
jgi:ribosome-interacting GTPase 1